MNEHIGLRGRAWFEALTGEHQSRPGDPMSVLSTRAPIGQGSALFLCVVPDKESRFPCVRDGQVGLEEAYALAFRVRQIMEDDGEKPRFEKSPIIAVVDVKSQAYGRREETAGIFLAAAAAADAYASARMAGHPLIALIAGHAFSGGFLTHGYQANRILAFDDSGVMIHAMHKEAAARITHRSVADLERLGHEIIPMSYDVKDFARLGLIYKLLHADDPMRPGTSEVDAVKQALIEAIDDTRAGSTDLSNRYRSAEAVVARRAGLAVRAALERQWRQG
jgi:malonate decarboxylase gamma subunit